MALRLESVSWRYGRLIVLNKVSFSVEQGEFLAVLGPSGCGKTTLLKIVSGLMAPQEGKVYWENADITRYPAEKRGFSLVFQNYALLPHLSVFDNIAFPLVARRNQGERSLMQKMRQLALKPSRNLSDEDVHDVYGALKLVQLEGFGSRGVNALSGGEAQRVALARALVTRPRLLLMDEPLANLDRQLKLELRAELKRIHEELGIAFVYVTHDQEEAVSLANRIALFFQGRLMQIASPKELLDNPSDPWVRNFFNLNNIISSDIARLLSGGQS